MTPDGDITDEPSVVVVVVVVVFVIAVGESGEEWAEMRILAFFDLVKIARVVTANIAHPPQARFGTSLGRLRRRAYELLP